MTDDDAEIHSHERLWMAYYGYTLRRRYGVGTFIAIFEAEVIDFGTTEATVRSFVEIALGETVFVADVPEATPAVTPEEPPCGA